MLFCINIFKLYDIIYNITIMDPSERLNLQKMINANDVQDMTDEIRIKKHSEIIKSDVKKLLFLKRKHSNGQNENSSDFDDICIRECNFLFNNYTDIFNKVKKDEIDLRLLTNFLDILREIEDGKVDQHEASFKVGKKLKEIYIDSALKKSDKLDNEHGTTTTEKVIEKNINWSQWKKANI
jgi:hypothetical protein